MREGAESQDRVGQGNTLLYAVAAVKGIEALAMMVVSDVIGEHEHAERISDADLKSGVDHLLHIACQVAVS